MADLNLREMPQVTKLVNSRSRIQTYRTMLALSILVLDLSFPFSFSSPDFPGKDITVGPLTCSPTFT